jgi:hypothetical protein
MTNLTRDDAELVARPAEALPAQTKSERQAKQSKRDFPIGASHEEAAKPARRKRTTKTTKRTQQAEQTAAPTDTSSEEIVAPVPQPTNNSAPAIGTLADAEPVAQGDAFLCTFTLSRPGLVGLNKLAIHLNDLQDSGSIGGWQAKGWEDPATKVRTLIGFASRADAIVAIRSSVVSNRA